MPRGSEGGSRAFPTRPRKPGEAGATVMTTGPCSCTFYSRVRFFNLLVQDRALGVEEEVCLASSDHAASLTRT